MKDESCYGKHGKGLNPRCKSCRNEVKRELRVKFPEKVKRINQLEAKRRKLRRVYDDEYNRHRKEWRRKYQTSKYKKDPLYKLKRMLRSRLYMELLVRDCEKSSFYKHLGCTLQELKEHIEKLWLPGMSWDNHGLFGWHIDHIVPLASATTVEELYRLFHYTNLQPLWAKDNLAKSDKII